MIDPAGPSVLVRRLAVAETAWEKTVGLLGRGGLAPDEGLLIPNCRCIHMVGMRFAIDAVFLDADWRVARIVEHLRPWRMAGAWRARHVLEIPAGAAARNGFHVEQAVCIVFDDASADGAEQEGNDLS